MSSVWFCVSTCTSAPLPAPTLNERLWAQDPCLSFFVCRSRGTVTWSTVLPPHMALIFLSILWIVDVCQPCCIRLIMYMRTINRDVHTYTWFTYFKSLYANRLIGNFPTRLFIIFHTNSLEGFSFRCKLFNIISFKVNFLYLSRH